MAIPDFDTLLLAVLRQCAAGPKHIRRIIADLSDEFGLTEVERQQTTRSGRDFVMALRSHWAKTFLKQAALVSQPSRGLVELTDRGRTVLANPPERIDERFLEQFPEFLAFKARSRADTRTGEADASQSVPPVAPALSVPLAPDEQITQAAGLIEAELRGTLLAAVLEMSPRFFEQLIIDLLLAMGYGGAQEQSGSRLGRSGDGGIDGVIREDVLGLDRIHLQAKRYRADNRIGVEAIRAFAGALDGSGSRKGVFITTSAFSTEAVAYAQRQQSKRIELIDGEQLTRLMVRYSVGTRVSQTVVIKKIDQDYFVESEDSA
jgi:restriction system protein